jgi:UDP-N-acetylmuramate--L-alanine ligase/UDP-N-acetylenolpyruvoylglucosamine reductase
MKSLTPTDVEALLKTQGPDATVYLVGAAGCGMSGLGHLFLDLGCKVAGSDLVGNETVRRLRERGAEIRAGHSAEHLQETRPFLVVYSSAIQGDNPELVAAQNLQLPVARRGAVLAALLRRQRGICVAGMHGKTTTTALAAHALEQLQATPSFAIGAEVPQLAPHARFVNTPDEEGSGVRPYFVAEADESDGTLGDFHPEHAVLLNVDAEHLDHFANLEGVCEAFQRFGAQVSGRLIYCADDEHLTRLFVGNPNAVSFGFHPQAQYQVEMIEERVTHYASRWTRFNLWHSGSLLGEFTTALLGAQNVSNAAAVIALLHQLQFQPDAIARAIRLFRGAARRLQELYRDERCRVFDDYGHHPTEVRATLQALNALGPSRLLVAFQPHRFSRTQKLMAEFAGCFAEADHLWLAEIYPASEPPIPGIDSTALAGAIRQHGLEVECVPDLDQLCAGLRKAMTSGDLVLFLGAGDITEAAHAFANQLEQEAAARRQSLASELTRRLSPDSIVRRDEPLAKRTTLRVGGAADFYVEPASEADLGAVLHFCAEHELPFLMLGRGSNLLIQDRGVRGVVISLAHPQFCRVEVRGNELQCGAGAKLKAVAVEARRHGLSGLEFLEGIPGSVGGALRMNAGAMGGSTFEAVESVRFMDFAGCVHERSVEQMEVEYRSCPHFRNHIALSAVLKGRPEASEAIAAKMNACSQKRWKSQPAAPSAGCMFKNPASIPAGRLIEELGLKGTRVGGAVISDVHGNFIVNEGGATAEDILELIELVKHRARAACGIELETEVEIIGEIPPGRTGLPAPGTFETTCAVHAKP